MMEILTIVCILLAAYILYSKLDPEKNKSDKNLNSNTVNFNNYKSKKLLTKTEYKFFMEIKQICQDNLIMICPKVRLEDFIEVSVKGKEYNRYRNMIKSRHIDFLLTDNNLNIIAAIELDDYTHNTNKAEKADNFKNELYNSIGLPLYRINLNEDYKSIASMIINNYKNTSAKNNAL